jgi:hypothetical protein
MPSAQRKKKNAIDDAIAGANGEMFKTTELKFRSRAAADDS